MYINPGDKINLTIDTELFDETIQGIRHKKLPIFSFQGHPEASPGPHDAKYLFDAFIEAMAGEGSGDDVAVEVVKGGAV